MCSFTKYIYDGDRIIEERNSSGTLTAAYFYGIGIDEVLIKEIGTTNRYHYIYDGLGTVARFVNSAGTTLITYRYEPYGKPLVTTSANRYMFTGREYDSETGLYYYRARMYDPNIGRFLQRDPIGHFDNVNLYTYVRNNPINRVDPTGLLSKEDPPIVEDFFGLDWLVLVLVAAVEPTPAGEVLIAGKIAGYTGHGIEQAIGRERVGVSAKAILEAVRNPIKVVKQANGAIKYIGEKATVILNQAGKIITTWGKPRR